MTARWITSPRRRCPLWARPRTRYARRPLNAGVWIFGAGLQSQRASVVATDGTVTDGPYPEAKEVIGGFSLVEVASREEALAWAAKFAVACRCAQEVRELLPDPEQDAMLRQADKRW
jgi:hypothetical protein